MKEKKTEMWDVNSEFGEKKARIANLELWDINRIQTFFTQNSDFAEFTRIAR